MLPFLKNKETGIAGMIIKHRTPDVKSDSEPKKDNLAMEAAAADLLRAFEQKDVKHIALALHSAFQIYDSLPHEEGPHTNEGQE
jgi:hypothetical protein